MAKSIIQREIDDFRAEFGANGTAWEDWELEDEREIQNLKRAILAELKKRKTIKGVFRRVK